MVASSAFADKVTFKGGIVMQQVSGDRRCIRQLSRAKDNWLELPVGKVTAGILSEIRKLATKR